MQAKGGSKRSNKKIDKRNKLTQEVDNFIKMTYKPNPFKDGNEVKEFYQKYMDKDEEQTIKDD